MFPTLGRPSRLVTALVLAVLPLAVGVSPQSKMDVPTRQAAAMGAAGGMAGVICQTADEPTAAQVAALAELGATCGRAFTSFHGFAATIPAANLERLASLGWVRRLSQDAPVTRLLDTACPAVGADVAWRGYGLTGRGVGVAVIDSGICSHPDFQDGASNGGALRLERGFDCFGAPTAGAPPFQDPCGHGTEVAGIIAGNGSKSVNTDGKRPVYTRTFIGVAPEARLVSCRVLDESGSGSVSAAVAAIEWCVANAAEYDIRVINVSFGHPVGESYETDPLCQACEYAWAKGIVVVVAAGNLGREGYGTILSPGNDPYVITVGAVNTKGTPDPSDDVLCSYSSRGPTIGDHVLKPDVVAPGNRVVAARHWSSHLERKYGSTNLLPTQAHFVKARGNSPTQYFVLSGTSMACAVVSGASALLLQQDPMMTPDQVKTRLMVTARKSACYDPVAQGAGYVDIPAALATTVGCVGPAKSPTVTVDGAGQPVFAGPWQTIDGGNIIWDPKPPAPKPQARAVYNVGASWVYQPSLDPLWSASTCVSYSQAYADISSVAIEGD